MNWYIAVLKNYAGFSGRARRKEYWMFTLFNIIFLIVAMILDNLFGTAFEPTGYGLFYLLYSLAVIIPGIAVSVRRLHDIGKSGWMLLIVLIPIIGWIWLLILMVTDSDQGENQYGPYPKEIQDN
ncbi:Inner membrane protein YhaI [hydrothermal vent metagenome]|uniref:Inner membrane protein YhaI n=1 Tax=hydrothermal vent metagenome TaxID=652676 RepID=A0A3B1CWH2_9ZZZZ